MHNFKDGDTISGLKIPTKEFYMALMLYAKSQGVPTYEFEESDFKDYPSINFSGDKLVGTRSIPDIANSLTIDEFISKCGPASISFKITDDYSAVIDENGITINREVISFNRFESISKIIDTGSGFNGKQKVFCPTKQIFISLRDYAKSKGVPVKSVEDDLYGIYTYLLWDNEHLCMCKTEHSAPEITIDQFIKNCEPAKLGNIGAYDTSIGTQGIQVGCQLVTWEKYKELKLKIEEWKSLK